MTILEFQHRTVVKLADTNNVYQLDLYHQVLIPFTVNFSFNDLFKVAGCREGCSRRQEARCVSGNRKSASSAKIKRKNTNQKIVAIQKSTSSPVS